MGLYSSKLGDITPEKLPEISYNKFMNSLIPYNVSSDHKFVHSVLIQSIRIAGLLHDIGHPPFSHIVEYALKSIYNEYKNKTESNETTLDFIDIMKKYFEDGKKLHEQMGDEISECILRESISSLEEEEEGYDENLYEILVLEITKKIFANEGLFGYLHTIIDGSLDADRLDYVTRDYINSGFDSGKIDYSRIINEMCIHQDNDEYYFCFPIKSINSIEDFIKRRYNIYKDIVYHHRVIKTDYLLEETVKKLIREYLDSDNAKNQNDLKIKSVIPFDISGLWYPLRNWTDTEKTNALLQWNDSWLMTVLRQQYFTNYYRKTKSVLSQQLSELLRNKKGYYSIIKRSENFKNIDDNVKKALVEKREEINALHSHLKKIAESKDISKTEFSNQTKLDIKGTEDFMFDILENMADNSRGFVIAYIQKHFKAISSSSFEETVERIVYQEIKSVFTNINVYDRMVLFRDISIGTDEPIYIYNNNNNNVCTLEDISGITHILRLDSYYLPIFYIYILVEDGDTIFKEKSEMLLKNIGHQLGIISRELIIKLLKERINQMEGA
jgi:HD superfamily phosphohydrolase